MKKNFIRVVIVLLMFVGINCYAQNAGTQTRALQGEWILILDEAGRDWTKAPFVGVEETIWVFEGDNFLIKENNIQRGTTEIPFTGTFRIVSDAIIIRTDAGENVSVMFILQGNTLTIRSGERLAIYRKR